MLINLIASVIPVFVLQFFILPRVAQNVGENQYGLIVTLIALLTLIPSTCGNVLNNIRLLHNEEYVERGEYGDFNVLMLFVQGCCAVIVLVFTSFYMGSVNFSAILFMILTSVVMLAREYYVVTFRIKLNYIAILIDNVLLAVGHVVGWLLFMLTGLWQFVYLIGYLISLLHISLNTKMWQEPLKRTPLFKKVTKDSMILLISNVITRLMNYADKLLLYPLIGGALMSVYYAASIFSKIASLVITPITSVILSYISKFKKCPPSLFRITFIVSSVICGVVYVLCLLLAEPVLSLIYPQFAEQAMIYIPVTGLAMVFSTLSTVINPFIMKFFNLNWQIKVNSITLIVYIIISYSMFTIWGLYGFCVGVTVTNLLKIIFLLLIYLRRGDKEKQQQIA